MVDSRRNSLVLGNGANGGKNEIRLKGRIRDEFVCPITRQIMREPVTAADGHTYDHNAISRWLANHNTSPKTGEELPSHILLPNFNLKRLIEDFLIEGGQGLIHSKEVQYNSKGEKIEKENNNDSDEEEFVLAYEKTIILHCLGPADSPFCGREIKVGREGISGGRKRMASGTKDTVIFTDATVSRRHFEINFNENFNDYQITDLGSAGGTFIRIPFGNGVPIYEGMMILVGKHQFICVDKSKIENDDVSVSTLPPEGGVYNLDNPQSLNRADTQEGLVDNDQNNNNNNSNSNNNDNDDNNDNNNNNENNENSNNNKNRLRRGTKNEMQINENNWIEDFSEKLALENSQNTENMENNGKNYDFPLALRCFAPEGSPIQDKVFDVDICGTTIGRKEQNDIALCHYRNNELLGLDSAVSGEHANISYDANSKQWMLNDGVNEKQSTNGTWYRLSAFQEMSEPHIIKDKSEILIGTLRFVAREDQELVEKDV